MPTRRQLWAAANLVLAVLSVMGAAAVAAAFAVALADRKWTGAAMFAVLFLVLAVLASEEVRIFLRDVKRGRF